MMQLSVLAFSTLAVAVRDMDRARDERPERSCITPPVSGSLTSN